MIEILKSLVFGLGAVAAYLVVLILPIALSIYLAELISPDSDFGLQFFIWQALLLVFAAAAWRYAGKKFLDHE